MAAGRGQAVKVTVLYGNSRRGTTRKLTQLFLAALEDAEVTEFSLPADFGEPCTGCMNCITGREDVCPHAARLTPILAALEGADVIVFASPVYVMGMSSAMKCLCDHLAWRWTVHRPLPAMFSKVGVAISTAAGPCTGKTCKDLKQQFFYLGVPKAFSWGEAVGGGWDCMNGNRRSALERKAKRLAARVSHTVGHVRPGLRLRAWFWLMTIIRRTDAIPGDTEYWRERGWLDGGRPWKA